MRPYTRACAGEPTPRLDNRQNLPKFAPLAQPNFFLTTMQLIDGKLVAQLAELR